MARDSQREAGEQDLRVKELRYSGWGVITQAVASLGTLAAVVVATVVACQGQQAYTSAAQVSLQQAQDNQLSTALNSIGSDDPAERIAGLVLLEQNAADRLAPGSIAVFGGQSAFEHYSDALDILSGYLRSRGSNFLAAVTHANPPFGLGYGPQPAPGLSLDVQYAVDELQRILALKNEVTALGLGAPSLDLSLDEIYEAHLVGADFSWVRAYMVGIDLRGSNLRSLRLSSLDNLTGSHLQCANLHDAHLRGVSMASADLRGADLVGANLRGANLVGADLQGADVSGADFSGAKVSGATLTGLRGTAKGLPSSVLTGAVQSQSTASCLADPQYWDEPDSTPRSSAAKP